MHEQRVHLLALAQLLQLETIYLFYLDQCRKKWPIFTYGEKYLVLCPVLYQQGSLPPSIIYEVSINDVIFNRANGSLWLNAMATPPENINGILIRYGVVLLSPSDCFGCNNSIIQKFLVCNIQLYRLAITGAYNREGASNCHRTSGNLLDQSISRRQKLSPNIEVSLSTASLESRLRWHTLIFETQLDALGDPGYMQLSRQSS